MRFGKWFGSAPLWAALLVGGAAFGQQSAAIPGFELEHLTLNPGGEGSLVQGTGALLPAGTLRVSVLAHYERNPLSFVGEGGSPTAVVRDRVTAHVAAAFAPLDWLELGLQVPVVLLQQGADPAAAGFTKPASFGLGTPLVNARLGLLSQRSGGPVDLSVELGVGLPVGSAAALARDTGMRYEPKVAVGRDFGGLRAGLEAGVLLRSASQVLTPGDVIQDEVGNEVRGGLSLSTTGEGLRGELDLRGAVALGHEPHALEALVGIRQPIGGAEVFALGGVGVGSMPGTPLFRVLAGVAFGNAPPAAKAEVGTVAKCVEGQPHNPADCPDLDDDGDGVRNAVDKCPTEPGPALRQGCPVKSTGTAQVDTDKDGVPDAQDKCPTEPGPASRQGCPFKDADGDGLDDAQDKCPNQPGPIENAGCPLPVDTDKDGVPDAQDKCPNEAGPANNQGCPVKDADKDGVPDAQDQCPNEAGPADNQGCPVASQKLEIKGKVLFDSKKSKLNKRYRPLLDQVAKVLLAHPEIGTVTFEGHSDGREKNGQKLSQARAEAVRDYLIEKGVPASRLAAKGFGSERPVDSDKTAKGRDANRRVEFLISTAKTDMEAPKR